MEPVFAKKLGRQRGKGCWRLMIGADVWQRYDRLLEVTQPGEAGTMKMAR